MKKTKLFFSFSLLLAILFYFTIFVVIEILSRLNYLSPTLVPAPIRILSLFVDTNLNLIWSPFIETLQNSFIAYVTASALAFIAGVVLFLLPRLKNILTPLMLFFQTVPIIAIAPLLVIYLGFGTITVIGAALIVCFFPVLSATLSGLAQTNQHNIELFSFYKATRWQQMIKLNLPSAIPTVLSGLKTSAGLSVVGVVSGEFIAGGGLGGLIDSARLQQRVDLVYAALILLSLIGLLSYKITEWVFYTTLKQYFHR